MKKLLIFISFIVSIIGAVKAQTKTYSGIVINHIDLESIPGVLIFIHDNVKVAQTDLNGKFSFSTPSAIDNITLLSIGYERTKITIPNECNQLEIVMILSGSYDFMTRKKVRKIRYKEFRQLTEDHLNAFKKGIFAAESQCFNYVFQKR